MFLKLPGICSLLSLFNALRKVTQRPVPHEAPPQLWEVGTPDVHANSFAPQGEAESWDGDSCPVIWNIAGLGSCGERGYASLSSFYIARITFTKGTEVFQLVFGFLQRECIHVLLWINVSIKRRKVQVFLLMLLFRVWILKGCVWN